VDRREKRNIFFFIFPPPDFYVEGEKGNIMDMLDFSGQGIIP